MRLVLAAVAVIALGGCASAPPTPAPRSGAGIEPAASAQGATASPPVQAQAPCAACPPPRRPTLAGGHSFACALSGGDVYCWGGNYFGQLGQGQVGAGGGMERSPRALRVEGISDAVAIVAGFDHVCALTAGGDVLCWGGNDSGQLGDGTVHSRAVPAPVPGLSGVRELDAGAFHTCALLRDGRVACWGEASYGVTGVDPGTGTWRARRHTLAPRIIEGVEDASQLAGGFGSECALRRTGEVLCWGSQRHGGLGDGTSGHEPPGGPAGPPPDSVPYTTTPVAVDGVDDAVELIRILDGGCVRHRDTTVSCWGDNEHGAVGDGTTEKRTTPVPVFGLGAVTALWPVGDGACARTRDKGVQCWGSNEHGPFGALPHRVFTTPTRVTAFDDGEPMAAWSGHSCARRAGGRVECWGLNWDGQLGNGSLVARARPTAVLGLPSSPDRSEAVPALEVSLEQGGQPVEVRDGEAVLRRGPFVLVLRFGDATAVFVSASFDAATYRAARAGGRMERLPGFRGTGIAEEGDNPEETLWLRDDAPSYWTTGPEGLGRFDDACREREGRTECRRTVTTLSTGPDRSQPLMSIRQPALYLVLAAAREEPDPEGPSGVHRVAIALRFRR